MQAIKQYRQAHNLTQRQLAEMLGVAPVTITHIESGRRKVSWEKAVEWEGLIGISRHELRPDIFGPPRCRCDAIDEQAA